MNTQRPLSVTIAAVLLALFSVLNLATPLIPAATEGVPALVIYLGVALGVVGLIAVAGLWALKRWSVALTIIVSLLNILSAAPGFFFAPTTFLFVGAIVTVAVFALIIVLVVLPNSWQAYA